MSTPKDNWDQADFLTHIDRMKAEADTLEKKLGVGKGRRPAQPDDDLIITAERMESYVANLRWEVHHPSPQKAAAVPPAAPATASKASPATLTPRASHKPSPAKTGATWAALSATERCIRVKAGEKPPAQPQFTGATAKVLALKAGNPPQK